LEDLGVDGRIILKGILKNRIGSLDWVEQVQDRHRKRALVNAAISLQVD
jgi:hypothetical protein